MQALDKLWQSYRRTWSREWLEVMWKEPERARPQYLYMTANSLLLTLLFGLTDLASGIVLLGVSIGSGLMTIYPGLRPGLPRNQLERWTFYAVLAALVVVFILGGVFDSLLIAAALGGSMIVMPFLWALAFPRNRGEAANAR
jgi:hypothetical protein